MKQLLNVIAWLLLQAPFLIVGFVTASCVLSHQVAMSWLIVWLESFRGKS